MILVTGDTHGDISRFKRKELKKLKKGDALIICGDFGFIWDGSPEEKKRLKRIGKKKYSVLFVEGAHENFEELENYELEEWNGGMTRKISGNLRQLMRGQVFDICGSKIFAFGGGRSEENDSYMNPSDTAAQLKWKQEIPSDEQLEQAEENLEKNGFKVDYVVTYEPPAQISEFLDLGKVDRNHVNTYLESLRERIDFKRWFFGRHHKNKLIPPKYQAVFDGIYATDYQPYPVLLKKAKENAKEN